MSRFSAKPKSDNKFFSSHRKLLQVRKQSNEVDATIHWMKNVDKQRKRSLAAKKAAATRKRNKSLQVIAQPTPVDPSYLEDLRAGLHRERRTAKESKPVVPSCESFASHKVNVALIRSACIGHATDFVEYVWNNCPAHYFNAVLQQLAQKLADNGTTYPQWLRTEARTLAGSIAGRSS